MCDDEAGDGLATILRCVNQCAQARDWRGRWRARRAAQVRLLLLGGTPSISRDTAQAAAEVGAWIARRSAEIAVERAARPGHA